VNFISNKLILNGREIYFMQPIEFLDDTPYGVLVTVKPEPGQNDRNIYLVSYDGAIKWQIEHFGATYPPGSQSYTGAGFSHNRLWAMNWLGYQVYLEPETGKILERIFTK
jgi:hypothetical protein